VPRGRAKDVMKVSRHIKRYFAQQKMPIALKANPGYTFNELLPQLQSCSDAYEVQTVKIKNVALDQQEVEELVQSLHHCPKLMHLELSYMRKSFTNERGPFNATFLNGGCASAEQTAGAGTLQFPSLLHLNMDSSGNRWGGFHFLNIAMCLLERSTSLTHLNLSWCWVDADQFGQRDFFLNALTKCKSLVSLTLIGNRVGDKNMESLVVALAQCQALTHLALNANRIGPLVVPSLARVLLQHKFLSHLDLCSNHIGDEGLEHLAHALGQCKTLVHLRLRDNGISGIGAGHLAAVLWRCPLLVYLNLAYNELEDEGTQKIAEVLPQCQSLAHLDLHHNWIATEGIKSLIPVLGKCASLKSLTLTDNASDATTKDRLRAAAGHVDIKFQYWH